MGEDVLLVGMVYNIAESHIKHRLGGIKMER